MGTERRSTAVNISCHGNLVSLVLQPPSELMGGGEGLRWSGRGCSSAGDPGLKYGIAVRGEIHGGTPLGHAD